MPTGAAWVNVQGDTRIDYEAEYNNRAKVPGAEAILQGWARDAAAFRAAHAHIEADLPYGPSPRQKLDIVWPGPARSAQLAMFIHGGYWQALDKHWVSHLARGLVKRGVAVAVPSYDLCPAVQVADIVGQMQAAIAFLARRHARPVFAFGHSAGGHLAAMLLATDWTAHASPPGSVSGALALSGLFDLLPLVGTSINARLGLDQAEARRLSPLHLPPPAGLMTALAGGLEGVEYARQSTAIAQNWNGACKILPDRHHFDIVAPLAMPESSMVETLARLIEQPLSRKAAGGVA